MMSAESYSEKSVSYQKKDGHGHACPSVFWYDNDKDLKFCFLVTRIISACSSYTLHAGKIICTPCSSLDAYGLTPLGIQFSSHLSLFIQALPAEVNCQHVRLFKVETYQAFHMLNMKLTQLPRGTCLEQVIRMCCSFD